MDESTKRKKVIIPPQKIARAVAPPARMTQNSNLPRTTTAAVWSLDPLLYGTFPRSFCESVLADRRLFIIVLATPLTLALIYPLMNRILFKHFQKYRDIEPGAKKVIVLHHAVEAVVLSLAFPIFTYYVISVNFRVHEDLAELKSELVILSSLCIMFMVMYTMELASRFESPRPIVVIHHVLAYLDGFLIVLFPTTVMFKTALILVYFISFEALTFVGLFMFRVFPKSKITQHAILAGILSFGASRPIQVLWICGAIFGSWNDEHMIKWQAVMQLILTCILTVLQLWTLKIHYGLWLRSRGERVVGSQNHHQLDPLDSSSVAVPSSTSSRHRSASSSTESKIDEDQSDRNKKQFPAVSFLMAQDADNSPV